MTTEPSSTIRPRFNLTEALEMQSAAHAATRDDIARFILSYVTLIIIGIEVTIIYSGQDINTGILRRMLLVSTLMLLAAVLTSLYAFTRKSTIPTAFLAEADEVIAAAKAASERSALQSRQPTAD